jgi:hypothetical protein
MRTALLLLIAFALALLSATSDAEGWRCSHSPECPEHQLCIADTMISDLGHCERIRVLP